MDKPPGFYPDDVGSIPARRTKIGENMEQDEKNAILHSMVQGLHALIFGVHSLQDAGNALEALGDDGEIHDYVHSMIRLLPVRDTKFNGGIK